MPEDMDGNLPTCPWCGYEHENYFEFDDGEHDCDNCGQPFNVTVQHYTTYTTEAV